MDELKPKAYVGAAAEEPAALVLDDDPESAAAIANAFERRGYSVVVADNLHAAYDLTTERYRAVRLLAISSDLAEKAEDADMQALDLFSLVPAVAIGAAGGPWAGGPIYLGHVERPVKPEATDLAVEACEAYGAAMREVMQRHVFTSKPSFLEEPIARIIHDLNNQITGLKGGIDLLNYAINLMQDPENQQKFQRYMGQFIQPSLAQIEYQIRAWRRLRETHSRPTVEVDLLSAVRQAILLAVCPLQHRLVTLLVDGSETPIRPQTGEKAAGIVALADFDHVVMALSHVLENACEVVCDMDDGRVEVELRSPVEEMCEIRVSDNGEGIDPEARKQVWRSFYSGREGPRMGMGLSIAKQLIDKHQGQIDLVDSDLGGACVQILLPATGSDS